MLDTLAKPFGWLLLWLYEFTLDYGLSIILFSLLVKVVLLPFMMKSKRSMMKISRLAPKAQELEKRHGANKQKYQEELAKLYRTEKVNPMSGCIWSLLPFPILIALYQAIRKPITIMMGVESSLLKEGGSIYEKLIKLGYEIPANNAYEEIAQSKFISEHFDSFASLSDKLQSLKFTFLGMDLSTNPDVTFFTKVDWGNTAEWLPALGMFLIPILAGVLTWFSTWINQKLQGEQSNPQQQGSMKIMTYMMPIITIWFAFVMPAALGLYWIASTFFGILQDVWLTLRYKKIFDREDAANNFVDAEKEAELARKRAETAELKANNATIVNPNTSKKKQQQQAKAEQEAKAAEWERKNRPVIHDDSVEPSRIGSRKFARGRAYDPYRFIETEGAVSEETVSDDVDSNSDTEENTDE